MKLTLAQLAELTQGAIVTGDPALLLTGFSTIDEAQPGDVTFLGNSRYFSKLGKSRASAVLAARDFRDAPAGMAVVGTRNPTLAFQISSPGLPRKITFAPGIHPSAVVAPGAKLDRDNIFIGPHAVIEDGARLGGGCAVHAGAYIGHGAVLGDGCVIHANAVIKDRCVLGNRVVIHSEVSSARTASVNELKDGSTPSSSRWALCSSTTTSRWAPAPPSIAPLRPHLGGEGTRSTTWSRSRTTA